MIRPAPGHLALNVARVSAAPERRDRITIVFTSAADDANPMAPGNFGGWSSASFKAGESDVLAELVEDGGHWVGAGARGKARCVVSMSDRDTPIYRYELSFEA